MKPRELEFKLNEKPKISIRNAKRKFKISDSVFKDYAQDTNGLYVKACKADLRHIRLAKIMEQ